MLIGLSASFCIKDIVEGRVRRQDVGYIILAIDPTDGGKSVGIGLSDIADMYVRLYWYNNPEECKLLFFEMYNAGQILCPRMVGSDSHIRTPAITGGHWLECKSVLYPSEQERIKWV